MRAPLNGDGYGEPCEAGDFESAVREAQELTADPDGPHRAGMVEYASWPPEEWERRVDAGAGPGVPRTRLMLSTKDGKLDALVVRGRPKERFPRAERPWTIARYQREVEAG